jgi:hypothetical protein
MWYIHPIEYNSVIKRNEIWTQWMTSKNMLSEIKIILNKINRANMF